MPQQHNGFTLLEILIVMLIISIVAGVAAVTINTNQRKEFEATARQLTNLVTLAEQEAMLRPATLGLAFSTKAFQFLIYTHDVKTRQNSWQPLSSSTFKLRALPNHTQITVKVNGKVVPTDGTPYIIINSSGDITQFVVYLGKTDQQPYYQIIGKANGEVTGEAFHPEE